MVSSGFEKELNLLHERYVACYCPVWHTQKICETLLHSNPLCLTHHARLAKSGMIFTWYVLEEMNALRTKPSYHNMHNEKLLPLLLTDGLVGLFGHDHDVS